MQRLKNSNRLFLLAGVLLCLVFFSSICDALIKVSNVVPDNGAFNNQRLYTTHFKTFGYEKVLRRITIYGSGFTRYMDINFVHGNISKPVTEFRYLSQTEVQVIPPDWEMPKEKNPVNVDIEISSQAAAGDRYVLKKGFTYNPPPEVKNIDPNIGPQNPSLLPGGKEIIAIKGSGFIEKDSTRPGQTIQVFIGTKRFTLPAISYKNSQQLSLEFSEPLYSEDTVDIVVVNPDGQISAVGERQYLIIGQPTIRLIRPSHGPMAGGNAVHIEGAGLESSSFLVRVNGQDVTASAPMDGTVVCIMPASVEKNVDIQVIKRTVNQRGRSFNQISNPLKYTYLNMGVYRVKPDIGEKGMKVTITGEDFFSSNNLEEEGATVEVFFGGERRGDEIIGGTKGVNLNIINSTRLEVEVPEGSGAVPVFVQQSWQAGEESTVPFVRQTVSAENKFTYSTGVVIEDFSLQRGSVVGGTLVKITGANFYPDASKITVTFGGVEATVSSVTREELLILTPDHKPGIVTITVKNPDGSSASLDGFEYIEGAVIEEVKPNFGPIEGGNPITIIGKHLLETNRVFIGDEEAILGAREDSKLVVNAVPPKITGPALTNVVAYVEGQPDATLPNGYTYRGIEARAIVPDHGPLRGGNTVTIQGRDFEGWDYDGQELIAPTVDFGGVQAAVISYSKDSIEVIVPEGTGTVPVKITVQYLYTTPGEIIPTEVKQTKTALTYLYNPLPVIASFRPLTGNQGDNLFIEGSGFLTGAEVKVGTTIVQPVSVTATEMWIIVPELQAEACDVDVIVINPDRQEATAPDKFEYLDCASSTPPADDECSPPEDGWRATLTLTSKDNSTTLIFGIASEATDGFNPGLDFAAPPLAPGAEFNAAFAGEFFDLAADIRGFDQLEDNPLTPVAEFAKNSGKGEYSWTVILMSQEHTTFEADVSAIPECFTVQFGRVDLHKQSSGILESGEHLLTVKPAEVGPAVDGPSVVTIHLERGWNLISFPGDLVDSSPQSILGGSVIQILASDSSVPATLTLGEGYWVLAIAPTELEVILRPGTQYTRAVKRGWNLIGSLIFDVPMPEGVIQLAGWNAKTQEYESPTTLLPTVGYWAFVLEEREITVSTAPPPAPGAPKATAIEMPWQLSLTLTDTAGGRTKLEMGIAPQATPGYDQHLDRFLPPPTPNSPDALIAGFLFEDKDLLLQKATHDFVLAQRSIMSMIEDGEAQWPLRISSLDSAATLHWDVAQIPKELSLQLVDQNRRIDMSRANSYRISPGIWEIQFVLSRKPQEVKPSKSLLLQNFPNPFNPETWIPYQLADSGDVSLTIYDVHGQIVRHLPLGHKASGIYLDRSKAAYWNGRNDSGERVSSGVYFYRLKSGGFTAVRKMVIAK